MTKTYIEPKVITLGRAELARCEELLSIEGRIDELSPYQVMSNTGVSYQMANAIVLGTIKKFREKGELKIIYVRGSGYTIKYPFECKICHKCIQTEALLAEHEKTHIEPPKEFTPLPKCQICGRAFGNKKSLILHLEQGCTGLEEPATNDKIKKVLKAHKKAKLHTSLDAPSNITDPGSLRPIQGGQ